MVSRERTNRKLAMAQHCFQKTVQRRVPNVCRCALLLLALTAAIVLADEPGKDVPAWIRATSDSSSRPTKVWYSPQRRIWVREREGVDTIVSDAEQRVKYTVSRNSEAITAWPLDELDPGPPFSLSQLTPENKLLGRWLLQSGRIVNQKSREVVVDGTAWNEIEFGLVANGFSRGILRVDPATKRPSLLVIEPEDDRNGSTQWGFDYPNEGPAIVARLKDPRATVIQDHRLPADKQNILDAIAANRRRIEDFRMIVVDENESVTVVCRKADRWRVDTYRVSADFWDSSEGTPDDEWEARIEAYIKDSQISQSIVSDGSTVYEWKQPTKKKPDQTWQLSKRISPLDLMSAHANSRLPTNACLAARRFPDLTPRPDDEFGFDSNPIEMPSCLLFKTSDSSDDKSIHGWAYVDPAKAYAVVRYETYTLPANEVPNAKSVPESMWQVEGLRKSPQGWWYPTLIRTTESNGDEREVMTTRLFFNFSAEMPDSLFAVE